MENARHSYDKSRRKGAIHVISVFSIMHSQIPWKIKTNEKPMRLQLFLNFLT